MRLHENTGFFLVGFAKVLASFDRLSKATFEIASLLNAGAVRAFAAEIRKSIARRRIQAVHGPSQHQRQGVLSATVTSREHYRVRKMIAREHLAQAVHGLSIAMEIRKRHTSQSAKIYHELVVELSLTV
jgi:hypothetical protein